MPFLDERAQILDPASDWFQIVGAYLLREVKGISTPVHEKLSQIIENKSITIAC